MHDAAHQWQKRKLVLVLKSKQFPNILPFAFTGDGLGVSKKKQKKELICVVVEHRKMSKLYLLVSHALPMNPFVHLQEKRVLSSFWQSPPFLQGLE